MKRNDDPLPDSVKGKFLLTLGDSAKVFKVAVRTSKGYKYETQIPYQHFRKSPVEDGLYIVTNIWMHPNATDPNNPSSYCYSLKRLRSKRRYSRLETTWRSLSGNTFQEKDFCSRTVNYNCLEWDQLIKDGKVVSEAWVPGDHFDLAEFKKDLGQVLYKHKASLQVTKEYDGPWDETGAVTLIVSANEKDFRLTTEYDGPYPKRRATPTWQNGKPNR